MSEAWRAIPGFPGYEASDQGRVRSARGVLKPWLSNGYSIVGLRQTGRTVKVNVHRLILLAFHGKPGPKMDARHLNGDKSDNRLINLAWGTRSENIRDQVRHGRHNHARVTHCPQGHEYVPENVYLSRDGRRTCKTCTKTGSMARYYQRKVLA